MLARVFAELYEVFDFEPKHAVMLAAEEVALALLGSISTSTSFHQCSLHHLDKCQQTAGFHLEMHFLSYGAAWPLFKHSHPALPTLPGGDPRPRGCPLVLPCLCRSFHSGLHWLDCCFLL